MFPQAPKQTEFVTQDYDMLCTRIFQNSESIHCNKRQTQVLEFSLLFSSLVMMFFQLSMKSMNLGSLEGDSNSINKKKLELYLTVNLSKWNHTIAASHRLRVREKENNCNEDFYIWTTACSFVGIKISQRSIKYKPFIAWYSHICIYFLTSISLSFIS